MITFFKSWILGWRILLEQKQIMKEWFNIHYSVVISNSRKTWHEIFKIFKILINISFILLNYFCIIIIYFTKNKRIQYKYREHKSYS
jgi:hypothetical protein